jgi:F-type H+-transporting ATPase subunit epsilon
MLFIAALKPGVVEYSDGKTGSQFVAVSGGFAEVTGDKVTVLADAAERAHEIDVARAEKAIEEAKRALRGEESAMPREEAVDALNRAMNRVRAGTQARQG